MSQLRGQWWLSGSALEQQHVSDLNSSDIACRTHSISDWAVCRVMMFEKTSAPPDVKDRLKATYDNIAPEYNEWTTRHHPIRLAYIDKLCSALPKLVDPNSTPVVLELGCGSGDPVLSTLLSRNPQLKVIANDLSDAQLDLARKNLASDVDRIDFRPGDMTKITSEDGSLTAVIALYSIIHLEREEQVEMLHRIHRWLEPGGCLLANFSGEDSEGQVADGWLHEKGWIFFSGYSVADTVQNLQTAGFEVETRDVENVSSDLHFWVIARKP